MKTLKPIQLRNSGPIWSLYPMAALTLCLILSGCNRSASTTQSEAGPFLGNGVKIGEVTSSSAIVWVRLTRDADQNTSGVPFGPVSTKDREALAKVSGPPQGYAGQIPGDKKLEDMEAVLPGTTGEVRLTYWSDGKADQQTTLAWAPVDTAKDYTRQFSLENLLPATTYHFRVEGRAASVGQVNSTVESSFHTAPAAATASRVVFTVVTGQMWNTRDSEKGQKIYPSMARLNPSFFVHTGDIVYYDKENPWVTHIDLARFKWNRTYSQPYLRDFHNQVPSYFIKDDHDSWQNDDWPTMSENRMGLFNWDQGKDVFLEQVPMGDRTYRTIRWGRDLQVWLVEGRDFRSPNDAADGPDKTIWGKEQTEWFKRTVASSDATFRVLISPTPVVGPDHLWKENTADNLVASRRRHEGTLLREFLGAQKDMVVVCGDRHWQYVSEHPVNGLREYSCGPTTDQHATELKNEDHRMIRFLRAKGGFLSVTVDRINGTPTAIFRHHDVEGTIVNEETRRATK